ncbi:unnamed protein product, partial [Heterotrigona itama]
SFKHGMQIKEKRQICDNVSSVDTSTRNQSDVSTTNQTTDESSARVNCANQRSVSPEESVSLIKNNSNENISNKQNQTVFNEENGKHKLSRRKKLTCDVCFLTFRNKISSEMHKKVYTSNVFKCHKCSAIFHKSYSLTVHLRIRTCKKYTTGYNCNFCNRRFSYKKQLQAHLFHIHRDEIFPTERKTVKIPVVSLKKANCSDDILVKSKKEDLSRKTFQCHICKKSFFLKENRREHMKLFHSIYMSSICNARYTSMKKLLSHYIRQHVVFKRKECCVCYENFNSSALLKRHMILHCVKTIRSSKDTLPVDVEINCVAFKKLNRCKGCHKRFWLSSCLQQHEKVCGRLKCLIRKKEDASCIKRESSSPKKSSINKSESSSNKIDRVGTPDLERMLAALDGTATVENSASSMPVLKSNNSNYSSSIQKRMLNGIACVKGYETTNIEKTKFPCTICGIQFQIFQNLCIHERTYCQPATTKCNHCNIAFSTKKLLQQHVLAAHTPSYKKNCKLFCRFCNQGFNKKKKLRMHEGHFHNKQDVTPALNVNHNCKLICNICHLLFKSHEHFIEHNIYYSKDQSYLCSICDKSFLGLYQLHHHHKFKHYPDKVRKLYSYKCNVCNEGFNYESHFHAHKLHVHLDDSSATKLNKSHQTVHAS